MNTSSNNGSWPGRDIALVFAVALGALVCQFVHPAYHFLTDDDAAILPKYVPQFVESFRQGVFYPRWMAEDFGGYGSPTFVIYSPLLYFLCSLLSMAGLSLPLAESALELLRLFTGGAFMYLLMRDSGRKTALASAIFYILLPSSLINLYCLNSPAGRFSLGFVPMSLFFIKRLLSGPFSRRYLSFAGASYALLIVSHIVTAFIFTPFALAYGMLATEGKPDAGKALKLTAFMGVGVLLSAAFFVPALIERAYMHTELFSRFGFNDAYIFGSLRDILGRNAAAASSLITYSIILESGAVAFFIYLGRRGNNLYFSREARFFLFAGAACIFMMSSLSGVVWRNTPLLSTVQFPYRFQPLYLVFISAVLGAAFPFSAVRSGNKRLILLTSVLLAGIAVYDLKLEFTTPSYSVDDAGRLAGRISFQYFLPSGLALDALGSLGGDNPPGTSPITSNDTQSSRIRRWGYVDREFSVEAPDGARLRVRTFCFPGWRAWVDGVEAPIEAEARTDAILLGVPPGRHEVVLKFTDTWPRKLGAWISAVTLAALIFPYGLLRRKMSA